MITTILPPNVAAIADLAAKQDTKFAITGIHLKVNSQDGTYTAVATDTRVLGMISGSLEVEKDDMPPIAGLETAPNGECEALVPVKTWKKALKPTKAGQKMARRDPKNKRFEQTAVVIGKDVVTFGGTDLEETRLEQTRQLAGRFPPVDSIIPKPAKDNAKTAVCVDAELLIKVLKAALAFTTEDSKRVTLEVRGTKPMTVRCKNQTQEFTGLVMPLS